MGFKTILLGSAMACIPALAATTALAQAQPGPAAPADTAATTLQEIVVTAQRRSENIQTVPITISAVSGEQLAKTNVKSLQDLTTLVSGFVGPGDVAFSSPHLRGVGSQIAAPGFENSVALYVDGVYIGANSPALLRLNDVAQVEVLKGPQGTLFGRNTTGGLLQVNTRDPGKTLETDVEAGYANYQTFSGAAYVNLPLGENVSTNFAAQVAGAGKGWGTNFDTGNPTYKLNSEVALRNKWDIHFGANTRLQLMGDYEYHSDLNYFLSHPLPGTIVVSPNNVASATGWNDNAAADVHVRSEAYGLTARLSQDLGFATLSDTLAYRRTSFDLDNFTANYAPSPYDDVHFFWDTVNRQLTDELQLASKGNGPFKWTTGLFYYNTTDINHQPAFAGPAGPPFDFVIDTRIKTSSIAAYGQGSYDFSPTTTLTLGGRFTHDHRSITGAIAYSAPFGFLDDASTLAPLSKNSVAIRASLAQKLSPSALIYASYNRGTKAGGFTPVRINNPPFGDEKLDAFEVGTKIDFLDRKARFNLSGFYYKYANIQLQSFKDSGPPSVYNGPSAKLYGLDAELSVHPTRALSISTSASYVHSAFGDFPSAEFYGQCDAAHVTSGLCTTTYANGGGYYIYNANAKGFELPRAPRFTGAASANYEIVTGYGAVDLTGAYAYNGGFYTVPSDQLRQRAFARVNASIQFTTTDEKFYVRIWGANLSNSKDTQQLNFESSGPIENLNSPRTYGVTFGVKLR